MSKDTRYAWTRGELLALTPPEDTNPIEWMERTIALGSETAHPGPFSFDLTPHLRFFCELVCNTGYPLRVIVKKPTQVGFTQAIRNCLDYLNEFDPLPTMFLFPDVNLAKDQITDRLQPHFSRRGQLLAHHISPTDMSVTLTHSKIYVSWASNVSRLSGRPIGRWFGDEVDKYKIPQTHRERDSIGLIDNRLRTFQGRQKAVLVSSPSTAEGPISKEYELCHLQYEWSIPCWECGKYWAPAWKDVIFPERLVDEETGEEESDVEYSARILATQAAWLRCRECGFEHTDHQRQAQVYKGAWIANREIDFEPQSVGLHMTSLGSLFITVFQLAAKFIEVRHDPLKLQTFINQELGEIWESVGKKQDIHRISECADTGYSRGQFPEWASMLIAAVDTQRNGFYWVVRAYGHGMQSALVDWGFAPDTETLSQVLNTRYKMAGDHGLEAPIATMAIDCRGTSKGSIRHDSDAELTEKVLEFAKTDPRIRPVMGRGLNFSNIGKDPIREQSWQYDVYARNSKGQNGRRAGVMRLSLDTQYFKDLLMSMIEKGLWSMPRDVDEVYLKHFDSETKVAVTRGAQTFYVWKNLNPRKPNHYWDCEVYALAVARYLRVDMLPTSLEMQKLREAQRRRHLKQSYDTGEQSPWVEGFQK